MQSAKSHAMRAELLPGLPSTEGLLRQFGAEAHLGLLESTGPVGQLGRYAYLALNPFLVFQCRRTECFVGPPGDLQKRAGPPLEELQQLLRTYRYERGANAEGLPPFLGGAVGYLGYQMLHLIEQVPDLHPPHSVIPDGNLLFCDTLIAMDRQEEKSWLITHGFADTQAQAQRRADERFTAMRQQLNALDDTASSREAELVRRRNEILARRPQLHSEHLPELGVKPVLDRDAYIRMVETAKEHIFAGDIFEVCTSQRFDTEFEGSALELYSVLRAVNSAPFASFLRFPEVEVASSSPERFLSLSRDGWAETRPIKGTRPRGHTPEEDAALVLDLKTCEKDQAENVMIVDLARNDLGRVCQFQSVTVPELRVVETYPFTHQLVSTVRGKLEPGLDGVDLFRATFPGGSMTGAPKVEAMKIIERLEPVERGIFSGTIGYFDFCGSFDLNIVIRTLVKVGKQVTFHTGGAIVADSDPAEEYQETLDKAHGLVVALELAREVSSR